MSQLQPLNACIMTLMPTKMNHHSAGYLIWSVVKHMDYALATSHHSPSICIDHALPAAGWAVLLTLADTSLVVGASVPWTNDWWASSLLFLDALLSLFLSLLNGRQCHLLCDFMWPISFCCSLRKARRAYQAPPRHPSAYPTTIVVIAVATQAGVLILLGVTIFFISSCSTFWLFFNW